MITTQKLEGEGASSNRRQTSFTPSKAPRILRRPKTVSCVKEGQEHQRGQETRWPRAVTAIARTPREKLFPRLYHRPRTLTAARPLGAGVYPTLNEGDIQRERAHFRSGVDLLSRLVSCSSSTSPSARWRSSPMPGGSDTFCRTARAQSHLNDAEVARAYNGVSQRAVNVPVFTDLRRPAASQRSLCSRRDSYDSRRSSSSTTTEKSEENSRASFSASSAVLHPAILQHSDEWREESRVKQEESLAVLSAHLKVEDFDDESKRCDSDQTSNERCSPADAGPRKRRGQRSDSLSCMKVVHCEVLGPSLCSDCTHIRQAAQMQQQQAVLYPGVAVSSRTLVAPSRLRRVNATLPASLFSQTHRLDCGCAISLHRDFLFPVLITDHDIHSRLRSLHAAPAAPLRRPISDWSRPRSDIAVLTHQDTELVEDGEEEDGEQECDLSNASDEDKSMSPGEMKVTVSYNTPSPDQGVVCNVTSQE